MSLTDGLAAELSELTSLLAPMNHQELEEWSPEWMSRQSLLTRDVELRERLAAAQGEFELEIALVGERVRGSTIEASFLGRFLDEFQSTINAVGQAIMFGAAGKARSKYPPDVLDASTMRLVATRPGSFVLGLNGPQRQRQLSFGGESNDEAIPIFDEAISRVLDVFDVAENEVAGERLPLAVSELGGHRPLSKMIKLAKLLAANSTAAAAVERSPYKSDIRRSALSAAGARRLQAILSRTQQTTEIISIQGRLTGVRWKSGLFDLETEDGSEAITGRIPSELRDDVRVAFDQLANMVIERTVTQTEVEGETTTTYRLVEIDSPLTARRFPAIDQSHPTEGR
jgi:hypothetical protein